METLNKNWFAFTLVAVIFGLLGFVLGRQAKSSPTSCPMHASSLEATNKEMHKLHMFMMKDLEGDMEWVEDVKIEKEDGENGEKKIKVRVKAKKE